MAIRLILLAVALVSVSAACAEDQTVAIDFGPRQRTTKRWNNITDPAQAEIVLRDAVDVAGQPTSVHMRQIDAWAGYNTNGNSGMDRFRRPPSVIHSIWKTGWTHGRSPASKDSRPVRCIS